MIQHWLQWSSVKKCIVPAGFEKNRHATVIWDNNDFQEETSTGEGTTHNTNGILVQRPSAISLMEIENTDLPRTKKRSVEPPPKNIIPYHSQQPKSGPMRIIDSKITKSPDQDRIEKFYTLLDTLFCFSKLQQSGSDILPGWTGYNTKIAVNIPIVSKIGYLPVIDASPTEMSTVHTILKRSLEIADELQLENIVVVFDQAIYCKAQQIRWQSDIFSKRIVIRLGDFHTVMSYLAVIGKRFQDSGLQDVLIESEIVAAGKVNGVTSGHHYNRSMKAHKLMFEALHRLRWKNYLKTVDDERKREILRVALSLNSSSEDISNRLHDDDVHEIMADYQNYVAEKSKLNPTFSFWSSYIDIVELLLLFVRATRDGIWDLHVSALKSMLAWYFAYDRINYARYLPAYITEMEKLPVTHESIHQAFVSGEFVVQRQNNYGFSQIACDQLIEQTLNRDSKTKGGLTGITMNKGAVNRWILSHHHRATIAKECRLMAGQESCCSSRKDLDKAVVERDEKKVIGIIDTIESMVDPFSCEGNELINISTGIVASADIKVDLLNAYQIGKVASERFFVERIQTDGTVDFFSPIKTNKLKSFANMGKKTTTKLTNSQTVTLKFDEKLFTRLLLIGKSRDVDLRQLLAHALSTVPASLGTNDGQLAKTVKSKLMHELEAVASVCQLQDISSSSAIMIDGMAIIQTLSTVPGTFSELANHLFKCIMSIGRHFKCTRIDFVIDRYPNISIKNCERARRAAAGTQTLQITRPDQKLPKQFKKYLASGTKMEMVSR